MSLKNYFENLIHEKNITYETLAKELKISSQTLYNLRNDNIKKISRTLLKRLSEYLHEEPYLIIYKSLINKEMSKYVDEDSLIYLCKKYSSGLGIYIRNSKKNLSFCGAYYKPRTYYSYSVVDGWKSLEIQFWDEQFKFENSNSKEIFLNDNIYYRAVLQYGISKVQSVDDKNVINYEITFQDETVYEKVKKLLPRKTGFNINLIFEPIDESLFFENIVSIDENDILFFENIYRYAHDQYYWKKQVASDELWIAAFECNLAIIPFVEPNIEYARARLIRKDEYLRIIAEEDEKKSPQEKLTKYLEQKIMYLKNGNREKVDLDYMEYQYVLRPIDATIHQGCLSLEKYRMIMELLEPLIEDYYRNI